MFTPTSRPPDFRVCLPAFEKKKLKKTDSHGRLERVCRDQGLTLGVLGCWNCISHMRWFPQRKCAFAASSLNFSNEGKTEDVKLALDYIIKFYHKNLILRSKISSAECKEQQMIVL